MTHFDNVTKMFGSLKYMKEDRASFLRDFMTKHEVENVLELGFFQGKSSAYFAAIMEDRGLGHLTTIDMRHAVKRKPSINEVLEKLGLSHRVHPIYAHRSYLWELGKMLQQTPRPQFDLCYLDGGHTWDVTGYGFVLVDMLLKPGGWIIFDDLEWTISRSLRGKPISESPWKRYSQDEQDAKGVRMVWEMIVPHLGYVNKFEEPSFAWGIAQKPDRK